MRISDWSSDVCSSDLQRPDPGTVPAASDHFRMRPVLDHPALPFGHGQGRDEIQRLSAPSQPCTAPLIGNGSSCPPSYGTTVDRAPSGPGGESSACSTLSGGMLTSIWTRRGETDRESD